MSASAAFVGHQTSNGCVSFPESCPPRWEAGRTVPTPLDSEGTVLITGGTGVLGTLLARHLVTRHGARNLLLISRKGRSAESAAAIESELTELGASVRIASCDAAERDSLQGLLAEIPVEHPLTALIHAAGVLDDAVFAAQTPRHLDSVLRPKVRRGEEPARPHRVRGPLGLRAVFVGSRCSRLRGPG